MGAQVNVKVNITLALFLWFSFWRNNGALGLNLHPPKTNKKNANNDNAMLYGSISLNCFFFLENHVELFKDFLNGFLLDVYQTDMA